MTQALHMTSAASGLPVDIPFDKRLCCEYCGKTFCRSDVKFRHVRKAHNIDCVKCPICQVAYNSIDYVEWGSEIDLIVFQN